MKVRNHSIVWIDHAQARVFHFNADDVDRVVVQPENQHVHTHHKANSIGSGHAPEDQAYFHAVVEVVGASGAILIVGPGVAKTALIKHIARHDPSVMAHIVGVETVDHPDDGALVAHARTYFKAADLMSAQK